MNSMDANNASTSGISMDRKSLSPAEMPLFEYRFLPPPQTNKQRSMNDPVPDLVEDTNSCRTRSSSTSDVIPTESDGSEYSTSFGTHNSLLGEGKAYIVAPTDWEKEKEMIVTAPYDYLISQEGKDLRSKLIAALNVWLQIDEESLKILQKVTGMLHNASLLVDDIQDGSQLRRGAPVAHDVFGVAQTINSANYVYFLAQKELFRLEKWPAAIQIFNEEVLNLHRGQGMDLYWRDTMTPPTEKEYLQMVSNKTGGLFRLAVKLMQGLSSTGYDVISLCDTIGLLYQILDDVKNLQSSKMMEQKGYCEDFTEGKFSFPIIHAIRNSGTRNNEILNVLKSRTDNNELKSHVVSVMENETKSFDYSRKTLDLLHSQAQEAINQIPKPNPAIEAILAKLVV